MNSKQGEGMLIFWKGGLPIQLLTFKAPPNGLPCAPVRVPPTMARKKSSPEDNGSSSAPSVAAQSAQNQLQRYEVQKVKQFPRR